MAEPHECAVPRRAHNGDVIGRRAAEIAVAEHRAATLGTLVAAVEIDDERRIVRRYRLGDFLPERVKEVRQTELLALFRLLGEVDEVFGLLGSLRAAIVAQELFTLFSHKLQIPLTS